MKSSGPNEFYLEVGRLVWYLHIAEVKLLDDESKLNIKMVIGTNPLKNWLVVSTHLKNIRYIRQIGPFPHVRMNIKNIGNNHLEKGWTSRVFQVSINQPPQPHPGQPRFQEPTMITAHPGTAMRR